MRCLVRPAGRAMVRETRRRPRASGPATGTRFALEGTGVALQTEQNDGPAILRGGFRRLLAYVGSLWFACLLLMLLLVALASATIFESVRGAEQALAAFYKSAWFALFLALLAVNVLAALAVRYPFSRRQIGFVLAHAGILVTLAGAVVSKLWAVEGQVGVAQGQTVDHFSVDEETLTVVNLRDRGRSTVDLDAAVFGAFRVVNQPEARALSLGDVRIELKRYLPDGAWSERVLDDNPDPQAAIEVSLSESGRDRPIWVFASQTAKLRSMSVSFRLVPDPEDWARLLGKAPAGEPGSKDELRIEYGGSLFEVPLSECRAQPVRLGDTGYTVRLLRYFPHAVIGADNRMTNASDRPVNPVVEVELAGPEGREHRVAFANFPDFRSMHTKEQIKGLKLTFKAGSTSIPATPIEVLSGPSGDMCVRFSWEGIEPITQKLVVGTTVASPWPDLRFTLLRRFDHARLEESVVPVDPVRKKRNPMILVQWTTPDGEGEMWLQKHHPQRLPLEGAAYELAYGNRRVPLGFALTLDRFRIRRYPGETRPRSFESHVTVTDSATRTERSRIISMNNPATFAGFALFQSSYRLSGDEAVSFLGVSRDPGRLIVFAGYIALLAGMVTVLGTRMAGQRRRSVI